jgi:hypothetical protein
MTDSVIAVVEAIKMVDTTTAMIDIEVGLPLLVDPAGVVMTSMVVEIAIVLYHHSDLEDVTETEVPHPHI